MTDYISREAAIEEIRKATGGPSDTANSQHFVVAVRKVPAADVRPVVRGHWIVDKAFDGYQLLQCDQCNSMMWNHEKETPNFCYNCGADMRPEGGTKE